MFSQACVKNSVHRGGGVHTPPGQTSHPRADTPPGQTPQTRQTPPQQMATAADGTHPTGMHSCLHTTFRFWKEYVRRFRF